MDDEDSLGTTRSRTTPFTRMVIGVIVLMVAAALGTTAHLFPDYKWVVALIGVVAGFGVLFPGSFYGNPILGLMILGAGLASTVGVGLAYKTAEGSSDSVAFLLQIVVASLCFFPYLVWTLRGFVRPSPFRLYAQIGKQGNKAIYEIRDLEDREASLAWFLYFLAAVGVYLFLCTLTIEEFSGLYRMVFK